jgi:integrase
MGKKRGAGEGTIYQRKDGGLWVGQASLPGGKRKAVYGKTRREVADKLAAVHQRLRDALPVTSSEASTEAWLRDWLRGCAPRLRAGTVRSYTDHVERQIIPAIGGIRLSALAAADVERMMDRLLATGLDADTVIRIRAILSNALNAAIRAELITRNVARQARPPRATPHRVEAMTIEHAGRILSAVRGTSCEGMVTLSMFTGLRRAEACGLLWADVDMSAAVLTVRHQLQMIAGEWVLAPPKTRASERRIPLPPQALAALEAERERQNRARERAGAKWIDNGLVFTWADGRPIAGRRALDRFKEALAKAGLPPMRFHDLRHAYATLLIAIENNPRVVMELMGHSTIAVTMNLYGHVAEDTARIATRRLGEAFGNATVTQPGSADNPSGASDPTAE